jgi:hypothetical protein
MVCYKVKFTLPRTLKYDSGIFIARAPIKLRVCKRNNSRSYKNLTEYLTLYLACEMEKYYADALYM